MKRSLIRALIVATGVLVVAPALQAQPDAYPQKPVRIVVGFPPGTPPEIVGRMLAQKLSTAMGQTFYVENRPGAGGTIAATAVAQAAPDGYTLMVGVAASLAVAPHFLQSARYDPTKAFAPIGLIARGPYFFFARSALPVESLRDLVGYAKANPNKLNFATPGVGTPHHLYLELMRARYGVDLTHVPFQGSAQMMNETVAGATQVFMDSGSASFVAQVTSGKLRFIGMTGERRSSLLPAVPTVAEQGFPDLTGYFWWALVGPAGVPRDIVTRLNAELNKALASTDIRERLRAEGIPDELQRATTPQELGQIIAEEYRRWGPIVKAAGLKAQ